MFRYIPVSFRDVKGAGYDLDKLLKDRGNIWRPEHLYSRTNAFPFVDMESLSKINEISRQTLNRSLSTEEALFALDFPLFSAVYDRDVKSYIERKVEPKIIHQPESSQIYPGISVWNRSSFHELKDLPHIQYTRSKRLLKTLGKDLYKIAFMQGRHRKVFFP